MYNMRKIWIGWEWAELALASVMRRRRRKAHLCAALVRLVGGDAGAGVGDGAADGLGVVVGGMRGAGDVVHPVGNGEVERAGDLKLTR